MNGRSTRRRLLNLTLVAALGIALAIGAYIVYLRASAPAARPAPGWILSAEMPNPRGETAVAVVEGRVYVVGGYTGLGFETSGAVSVYDSGEGTWAGGPSLPEPRNHSAAAAHAGVVYVAGGASASGEVTDSFWALTASGSWEDLGPMPSARSGHRVVESGGKLYVIGGIVGAATDIAIRDRVLIFDPGTHDWTSGAAMPAQRDHLSVVVVDGEIWAIGGRAGGVNHTLVDIYDPETDTWRAGPPLPAGTSGAAEAIVDGIVYLSGGEDPALGEIVDRHWRLDTAFGDAATWEPLAPPPLAVHGVPGVALDGHFAIIAGSTRPGGESSTAWTGATQVLVGDP
jgi:N-acetylneuraminic acid mutarotase